MKFIMLINVKMPTIIGILTFISMMNTTSESLKTISLYRVPTSSGNHGKPANLEKKFHTWKNQGVRKNLNIHGKIMEFCEIY